MQRKERVLQYYAIFDRAEEGGYNVSFPSFPGCVTFGRTLKEAREMAKEVLQLWFEELQSNKQRVRRESASPRIESISVRVKQPA